MSAGSGAGEKALGLFSEIGYDLLMAKITDEWKVLPHDPLEKLEANLWRVEGAVEGIPLRRVMTIVRRPDGTLVIHNAMALQEPAMKEIEAWGKPTVMIVPSGYHRMDAPRFKKRYPDIKIYCPDGATKRVAQVVSVDGPYGTFPIGEDLQIQTLDGTNEGEGVLLVHSGAHVSLVFNDLVFNMPHLSGFPGFVMKYVTQSSGGPRVSRLGRLFLLKDKAKFAAHLERLADTKGLTRVIVAHHTTITSDPAGALRAVATSLK